MVSTPILERAQSLQDQIVAWRRDIHVHPELGFQEFRTSRLVADTLTEMGLEVQTGVGKTGVVAYIGEGSPVIGIRADMDALPINEENEVPYASQTENVMHACGHDAHTAILLGIARILTEMPDRPPGQIRLFFQPSEEAQDAEGKSGAMRMVEEGALDEVDHVIALHVSSGTPAGQIEIRTGPAMAAVDTFYATIYGEGCHGAYPHTGVDPIFILAQVINAIHGVRARRINPMRPAVISIGAVQGGSADNVIPDEVMLKGTIRSYDDETRHKLWSELEAAVAVSKAFGGNYDMKIVEGYPATVNDEGVAQTIREVVTDMFGADRLYPPEAGMGAEDFGYMTRKAPGAMFYLGAKRDEVNRPHHSPIFDIDEEHFHVGAAVLVETACRLLRETAGQE
jgi:amidohydrolase